MRQDYPILVILMGDISKHFFSDGRQQDTDEDGKPVGEPHNPNDRGGEDLPHRLSGQPLHTPSKPAAPASSMGSQYTDGEGGAYYHSSGVHTGEATAEACGVDLSGFNDDMDGL
jgi:hypothetical protein